MTKRLTTAERNGIIYNFINGVQDENYAVIKTKTGKYQVRKRKSPFVPPTPVEQEQPGRSGELRQPEVAVHAVHAQGEPIEQEEPDANVLNRISNEELLMKLSSLLDIKNQEAEEEEYIDTAPTQVPQVPIQQPPTQVPRRGGRRPLSLI